MPGTKYRLRPPPGCAHTCGMTTTAHITLRELKNGKFRVLVDGQWQGTTLRSNGSHASGPYLTTDQQAEVAYILVGNGQAVSR